LTLRRGESPSPALAVCGGAEPAKGRQPPGGSAGTTSAARCGDSARIQTEVNPLRVLSLPGVTLANGCPARDVSQRLPGSTLGARGELGHDVRFGPTVPASVKEREGPQGPGILPSPHPFRALRYPAIRRGMID